MTASPEVTPKAEKPTNPRAYDEAALAEMALVAGQAYDVVEVGGIDFAYIAATSLDGISLSVRGNEAKASQLYNRALRIDMPAKCDARERIKTARKNGTLAEVVTKLQAEFLSFDVTTIATRAPRTPPTVEGEDKAQYSRAEVDAMLAAKGIRFVTK